QERNLTCVCRHRSPRHRFALCLPFYLCARSLYGSENPRGVPGHDRIRRDAPGDYAPGPDDGILPDREVAQDGGAGADRSSTLDQGRRHFPIFFGLQAAARGGGARVDVVDERYPMSYEDVLLDSDAFADKSVAGDLAVAPDPGVLLDLDKRADLGVITNLTAVQVDELREFDVLAQLDVGSD